MSDMHPYGSGSHAPLEDPNAMPPCYPIKGNDDSMKYHRSDSSSYGATVAEVWFVSPAFAEAAGFSLAGSHPKGSSSADFEPGAANHPCSAQQLVDLGVDVVTHPYGAASRAPLADVREMPECYPIKGNVDSMLYHRPDSMNYGATIAEVWFVSPKAAESAGFALSSTHPKGSSSAEFEPGSDGHPCTALQLAARGIDQYMHPYGRNSHAPLADVREMPECYPIKGNVDSMLYHRPDSMNYGATIAEVWFVSPSSAEAAGFALSSTHPKGSSSADFELGTPGHSCTAEQFASIWAGGATTTAAAAASAAGVAGGVAAAADAAEKNAASGGDDDETIVRGTDSGLRETVQLAEGDAAAGADAGGLSKGVVAGAAVAGAAGAAAGVAAFADLGDDDETVARDASGDNRETIQIAKADAVASAPETIRIAKADAVASAPETIRIDKADFDKAAAQRVAADEAVADTSASAVGAGAAGIAAAGAAAVASSVDGGSDGADAATSGAGAGAGGAGDSAGGSGSGAGGSGSGDSGSGGSGSGDSGSGGSGSGGSGSGGSGSGGSGSGGSDGGDGGDMHPFGPGSHAPFADVHEMPACHPIKGNADSMKYHRPDSQGYPKTKAEVWFVSPSVAEAAGFVLAGSHPDGSSSADFEPGASGHPCSAAEVDGMGLPGGSAGAVAGIAAAGAGAAAAFDADETVVMPAVQDTLDDDETVVMPGAVSGSDQPFGLGSRAPLADVHEMPACHPIKGNADSMKYHRPDSQGYQQTKAEVWFVSPSVAEAAGFALAGSHPDGSSSADFEPGASGHPCTADQLNGLGLGALGFAGTAVSADATSASDDESGGVGKVAAAVAGGAVVAGAAALLGKDDDEADKTEKAAG